ncbi:MAG: universal stress protein [Bacteroidia bacterium]|nr:universal stress protein [Bacteroidia bacterium]
MKIQITKILVGYDHSPASEIALSKSMELAVKFGAEVHMVYVESAGHWMDWDAAHAHLNEMREKYQVVIHIHHQKGRAYKEIVHVEKAIGADLIIIGSHSHAGAMPFLIGSTAFRIVSGSSCPVITVQETAKDLDFSNLIVPLVDSPESRQKLAVALGLAEKFDSTVHIVCLSKATDAETEHHLMVYCKQAVELCKTRNVKYTYEVCMGVNVSNKVIEFAKEHQGGLILMMTETESAGMFMGTVAQQLINHSPIPVMAIHNKHVEGTGNSGY